MRYVARIRLVVVIHVPSGQRMSDEVAEGDDFVVLAGLGSGLFQHLRPSGRLAGAGCGFF